MPASVDFPHESAPAISILMSFSKVFVSSDHRPASRDRQRIRTTRVKDLPAAVCPLHLLRR
jgi:hypothetical protein